MSQVTTTTITKQELGQVFTTKKGLFEFLTIEMEYFLPAPDYTNIEWLRDLWQGKKRVRLSSSSYMLTMSRS